MVAISGRTLLHKILVRNKVNSEAQIPLSVSEGLEDDPLRQRYKG